MVVLNGTLFIELILFLLFLWAVNKFILRPLLDTMDSREDKLVADQEKALEDEKMASDLELQHRRAVANAQREVHESIERDRRKAQEQQIEAVTRQRREADQEVTVAHEAAQDKLAAERAQYNEVTPQIVAAIQERLGLGGSV